MAKTRGPSYWFCLLEMARHRNDFAAAAEAQRELDALGVKVRYAPQRRKKSASLSLNDKPVKGGGA